jgi:NADH-quinone oxidoreductase subunit I
MKIKKPELTLAERLYLPAILKGMSLTFSHLFRRNVVTQYPEQKHPLPEYYRGLPALVKDQDGRTKCVGCFLCEWICPPKAITIQAQEIDTNVEKGPEEFEIDFLRCILCGYCEEVCPEEAIFMTHNYEVVGTSRAEMVYNKEQLLELGGVRQDDIKKWDRAAGRKAPSPPVSAAQLPEPAASGGRP